MFGNSEWKKEIQASIKTLELQVADLKKSEVELKAQNAKLNMILKNMGRKLVMRLPISLESLDKGLIYDLIFPDEVDTWRKATGMGTLLDIRPAHEFSKGAISGAINVPLDQLSLKIDTLERDKAMLIVCENGIRSVAATELLGSKGFPFLYVLKGGMALMKNDRVENGRANARESAQAAV